MSGRLFATFIVWLAFFINMGKWQNSKSLYTYTYTSPHTSLLSSHQFIHFEIYIKANLTQQITQIISLSSRLTIPLTPRFYGHNTASAAKQTTKTGEPSANDVATAPTMAANAGVVTRKQAAIWIPILLAIISVASVYALYAIDDIKNRDTILYAKFLANLKDR